MDHNVTTRKEIRNVLNQNIGNVVANQDFSRPYLLGGYIPVLMERGILERVGRGQYKILKKVSTPKRKQPVESTRTTKFESSTIDIREALNRNVGNIIVTQDFTKPAIAASYLAKLFQRGFLERTGFGKYKVLKKITLKKKGPNKGKKLNQRVKDLSPIPTILNSSKGGLVVRQIQTIYENMVPKEDQVNSLYLYRLLGFAKKKGIVKENGADKSLRRKGKGPYPKKLSLVNPNITRKEWDHFVDQYRLFYQYKKENKVNRKFKRKTIMSKVENSDTIIDSFGEDRDNPNKQLVEDHFFKTVKKYLGVKKAHCFAITGPDYFRHVTKLFGTIANKVTVCEIQPDVFDVIYRKAQVCPHYTVGKVSLYMGDVNDALSTCQYIDLDLMACICSIDELIIKQIKHQSLNCDGLKFLTFTTSIRNDGGVDKRLSILKKILLKSLNVKLNGFRGGNGFGEGIEVFNPSKQLSFCLKHIPEIEDCGKVKDIQVFTYQDSQPMMSVLITYK
jgi:hypothetical protein